MHKNDGLIKKGVVFDRVEISLPGVYDSEFDATGWKVIDESAKNEQKKQRMCQNHTSFHLIVSENSDMFPILFC